MLQERERESTMGEEAWQQVAGVCVFTSHHPGSPGRTNGELAPNEAVTPQSHSSSILPLAGLCVLEVLSPPVMI